jgi:hypothetical protein
VELTPGTILLDKYRVDAIIGTGGMGRVVRASHMYLHQPVAIKLMLPELATDQDTVARFLREAQANVRLRSEHIVRVLDVGTLASGTPFMVMEYLEGNDLNQILCHHGPQLPSVVCDLMLQACEGMAEAHSMGIIHRDIKPSNFFITQRPDGSMLLKILDFGISKSQVAVSDLTGTQTVMGTPTYMAPEQMKSGKRADARSDIWSMGVVMYQLVQGQPPFAGESYADLVIKVGTEDPMPLHVQLPPGLSDVIMRCLARDPADRHQTVAELARLIAPFSSDPIAAAQLAGRTSRTFLAKQGQLVTPPGVGVPLSPALLTPANLTAAADLTSVSQSKGEITRRPPGVPGWAVTCLVAFAGAAGFVVSHLTHGPEEMHRDEPYVQAPPAVAKPAVTPILPAPEPTTPVAAGVTDRATVVDAGVQEPTVKVDPTIVTKAADTTFATATAPPKRKRTDDKKRDDKKDVKKPDDKKPDDKKPDDKKVDNKPDDLFDSRH